MPEQKPKPEDLVQDISHKLHGCSLYKLLCQSLADQDIVKPKEYLTAALQNFALTLIITWTITLLVNPEAVKDHPAKQIIGADNPCFGWDYPPASYVAMFMNSANVYFTWRWAYLENARTKLQSSDGGGHHAFRDSHIFLLGPWLLHRIYGCCSGSSVLRRVITQRLKAKFIGTLSPAHRLS